MEINKTKDADLMLLGNKELYNKLVNKNEKSIIMKNDFIKYKKEIKTKINELFTMYSDPSNNCLFINNNNEDYKYLSAFNSFVNHYIENIKTNNFKKKFKMNYVYIIIIIIIKIIIISYKTVHLIMTLVMLI